MIRDTVFFDTPDRRAMSLMVDALPELVAVVVFSGGLRAGM
jgi:hypothetical protein